MTTSFPVSQDGIPILLVGDEPFAPEEAEFFLESATSKEIGMLAEGGRNHRNGHIIVIAAKIEPLFGGFIFNFLHGLFIQQLHELRISHEGH
jgi:hypothetical protein